MKEGWTRPARILGPAVALVLGLGVGGCGAAASPDAEPVTLQVPQGAVFSQVVDSLEARRLVAHPLLFRLYARAQGADRKIQAGHYAFPPDATWSRILDDLTAGRVLTVPVTIPEGFTLQQIATRLAEITDLSEDSVRSLLSAGPEELSVEAPGPDLEGYLFPDTYLFAPGASLSAMVRTMLERYRALWTPDRTERLEELELSERELLTLASIIQAEAGSVEEMDTISAVFHNRLRRGFLLQADPTVLYALGGHRPRLLYAAMDSVADHPYNTYTHPGLPPGPIGAPGEDAVDAALHPAETDHLYFVARPDGTHLFSRTLEEHNRAVARVQAERAARERERRRDEAQSGAEPQGP